MKTIKELNDFKIKDLPSALTRETLMEGYWFLIPEAAVNCQKLHSAGIKKATDLWAAYNQPGKLQELIVNTGISEEYLKRLSGILAFNKFKPIALRKIENIKPQYLNSFQHIGITNTGDLLAAGRTKKMRTELAAEANIPETELEYLIKLADLMRLPGVKNIRAKLYLEAGIDCVEKFAGQRPDKLREYLQDFVEKTQIARMAPLPKEIATCIAWAKILPIIAKF